MSETNVLLQEIQSAIGCSYLSDLRTINQLLSKQAKSLIRAIPLERYPLQEWNEAAAYITGKRCHFLTTEKAKESILASK